MKSTHHFRFIMTPLIFLFFMAGTVGFYFSERSQYKALEDQIGFAIEDFKTYLQDPSKAPSEKELKEIGQHKNNLQDVLSQMVYSYKSMASQNPPFNPLEFKEKLLNLNREYSKLKIVFPENLGFREFAGSTLPQPDQMAVLTRQLHFIIQLLDLLVKNHVEAVLDIKRFPVEKIQSTVAKKDLFSAYHLGLSFKISHKNFLSFVDELSTQTNLVRVRQFSISSNFKPEDASIESQLITVNLNLALMEYEV